MSRTIPGRSRHIAGAGVRLLQATTVFSILLLTGLPRFALANPAACIQPLSSQIPRSCVVESGVLWRGSEPDKVQISRLVQKGMRTLVNLEAEHDDLPAFRLANPHLPTLSPEGTSPAAAHPLIHYFHIRSSEVLPVVAPKYLDRQVVEFMAIMRTRPKPVYVHCRSGQNRTGVMIAAYRIFSGMPVEQAVAEMQNYRGIWQAADARYLRTYTPEKVAAMEAEISRAGLKLQPVATIQCDTGVCRTAMKHP